MYFSLENIKFNFQILRNIDNHTTLRPILSHLISLDMMKMFTQYDFVFYLNLQFWHVFDKILSC